ncbi:MAG: DNA/RNA non-specific endonuclease [Bacteroidales bacterium]|nr:DNA/RNA non-specific endonuclease [Bacteroidales bacterium]
MKKVFFRLGLFAAVSAMLLGCAQKENSEPEPEGFKRTVQVTFTKGTDTKTAIVEGDNKASYVWTEGDEQYFKVWENTTVGSSISASYSSDMKKATLTVSFNTVNASEYVYKALFAKGISGSDNLEIQANQNPTATSYDPSADAMYAEDITSSSAKTSLDFILHRAITVNKMTLKGMTAGEKVGKVELTFNKNVTGYFNPSNGEYSLNGKKISLSYPSLEVGDNGEFPVYFTSAPGDGLALTSVVVYTDQNSYNRTDFSKTYNFSIGKMVRFGINMAGTATPVTSSDVYTLVSSSSDLTPGTYIIAASALDFAMGPIAGTSTKYHSSESITKVGNTISLDNTSPVLILELAKNGNYWTIKNIKEGDSNYGKYLYWYSGNSCNERSDPYNWTIDISNGVATITCSDDSNRHLLYNSQDTRFACYTSSQKPIALYKKTGGAKPLGIYFENESYSFAKNSDEYNSFTGQTVTKEDSDTRAVCYEMSGNIGIINSSSGEVTLNGTTGTATVIATVGADDTHSSGSVSYTITVTSEFGDYDLLDYEFIGVTTEYYLPKSNLDGSSQRGSKYSTYSAGGTSTTGATIQLRTSDSKSGIVSTASGGKILKVEFVWNSHTVSGRKVQVYGKNTPYSSTSDLYDSNDQGTLIGTVNKGVTTLTVTGSFKYIGIKSADGALYLDEIRIYWTEAPATDPVINVTSNNPIYVAKEGGAQSISYNITNPVSGESLSASANVSWISNISVGASTVTFSVAAQSASSAARAGSITLIYNGAVPVQVAVSQEAGEGGSQAANGWLELPAMQTGNDFFNDFFKVGSVRNYSYMYQYSTYTSLWVAYPLYKSVMSTNTVIPGPYSPDIAYSEETRGTDWDPNPHLAEGKQVNVWSYSYNVNYGDTYWSSTQGSEYYARGHQIPNADRNLVEGELQTQTFYATNSTPQLQNKFNSSIWAALEKAGRDCARGGGVNDTVYVVTGAAFNKVGENRTITYIHPRADENKNVPVPNYYWKVFLKVKRSGSTITSAKAIGFWLEHKQYSGTAYESYACSVDQIEQWTGFNFFVNLPSNLEETAESNTNWNTFKNF